MHFSICRKRSSFDWLCTPVLCPTTGFGVTTDCSKHPEKPSLSVVGCSGGDGFCDLAGGLLVFRKFGAKLQTRVTDIPCIACRLGSQSSALATTARALACRTRAQPGLPLSISPIHGRTFGIDSAAVSDLCRDQVLTSVRLLPCSFVNPVES